MANLNKLKYRNKVSLKLRLKLSLYRPSKQVQISYLSESELKPICPI